MLGLGGSAIVTLLVFILAIVITLAPLFIWKWVKANNDELKRIRLLLENVTKQKAPEADESDPVREGTWDEAMGKDK